VQNSITKQSPLKSLNCFCLIHLLNVDVINISQPKRLGPSYAISCSLNMQLYRHLANLVSLSMRCFSFHLSHDCEKKPISKKMLILKNNYKYHLDIEECQTNTDNCHVDANCTNTKGSFYCTCRTGYSGNGVTCVGEELHKYSPDVCS